MEELFVERHSDFRGRWYAAVRSGALSDLATTGQGGYCECTADQHQRGERSSAYMVIGSECCDIMIRFKFGACGLAYECVAGEIAMETEMIGLDWVSIIFLPLRIKLIEMSTLSYRCKRYSQIFVSVVLAWNKRSVRYHYIR